MILSGFVSPSPDDHTSDFRPVGGCEPKHNHLIGFLSEVFSCLNLAATLEFI